MVALLSRAGLVISAAESGSSALVKHEWGTLSQLLRAVLVKTELLYRMHRLRSVIALRITDETGKHVASS